MELIDKQVLKDEYRKAFISNLVDKERGIDLSEHANDAIKAFENFVDSLPFIDSLPFAENVGHWEWKQYDIAFPEIGNYHCSSCDAVGKNGDNYCSICGAKMQEVTNEID